ncbi:MAG: catechol 2,3-dioxygenase-like lactoylglutathione lyase family enzyme [Hyphomicrobiaceae bacterium]|jgi:catechol 2,3-dioxygenase-like lactoylglutathione lyase family enzyme
MPTSQSDTAQADSAALTNGVHHVGLTVPSLADSLAFFTQTLGFRVVGEKPDYPAAFVSDGSVMVTLWQAENAAEATPFDRRRNVGLHHLALRVDPNQLDDLHARLLNDAGVQVEFAPELLGNGPTRHMMCRIPGGIRLELISPVSS